MKKVLSVFIVLLMSAARLLAQQNIFSDGFESGRFGNAWKVTPGNATGIAQVVFDYLNIPAANSGSFGVVMGKSASGSYIRNTIDLRLDLSSYQQVELNFWIKDYFDDDDDFDGIFFSDDGGANFKHVFKFEPSKWNDNLFGQFPPLDVDALAKDSSLTLTNQFVIRFQQYDNGAFGSFDNDGFFLDDIIIKATNTTHAKLPFNEGFENGAMRSAWRWANANYPSFTSAPKTVLPQGWVEVLRDVHGIPAAHAGSFGLTMGRRVNGPLTTNAIDLHLDLTGQEEVDLSFWIKDVEQEDYPQGGIFFSDDGGLTFTAAPVYRFQPSKWNNQVYGQLPPIDVDGLAKERGLMMTDKFVIRFQQYGAGAFNVITPDGIFLDDIEVKASPREFASLPFFDGFESGTLSNSWKWANANYPSSTSNPETALPQGWVEVLQNAQGLSAAHDGNYGLVMGRRVDGPLTTNAIDLHLDLSGQEQVELSFWIKPYYEDTHPQDGIFFSNDGGRTFVPSAAFQFDPSRWLNNRYQKFTLDIDELAEGKNLPLTNRFVIRFQQYGAGTFASFVPDGIFIDDVSVDIVTAVDDQRVGVPLDFTLNQNHPNPFNPSTKISFALPSAQKVTLKVFDLAGKEVATLLHNERKAAGTHEMTFDAKNLPSGVYLYRLQADEFVETKKMLLAR